MADQTEDVFDLGFLDPGPVDPGMPFKEYVEDGLSEFIFGGPGELTVDASFGKAAFPVPTSTLVFESNSAFIEFMIVTFNARTEYVPESGIWIPIVETTTLGIPYASDPSGSGMVEVLSPISTFLGGPGGYFLVGGKVFCVDPLRCSLECSPPLDSTSVQATGNLSLAASVSGLDATLASPIMGAISPNAAPAQFDVKGGSYLRAEPWFEAPNRVVATVWTEQTSGFLPTRSTLCGPEGGLTLPNGVTVKFPNVCTEKTVNPNALRVEVEFESSQFYDQCKLVTVFSPSMKIGTDVPRVSYETSFHQFEGNRSLSGFKAFHDGSQYGVYTSANTCWSTGCFTSDPCK